MAEKPKQLNISFELPMKRFTYVSTLKVPNFFLPAHKLTSTRIDSPSFEFENATWSFQFTCLKEDGTADDEEDEDDDINNGNEEFTVVLTRLESEIENQKIQYKISLLNEHEEEEQTECNDIEFSEDYEEHMDTFYNFFPKSYTPDTLTFIICLTFDYFVKENSEEQQLAVDRDVQMLSKDFEKLLLDGKNYDLTLRVADAEFRVHKDIMMARSEVFRAMLSHDTTERNNGIVDIPDADPKDMKELLFYMYCGKVRDMNKDNATGLYYLADKYNMILLKKACVKFIGKSLTPSQISDVFQLAQSHSDADLKECLAKYISKYLFRFGIPKEFRAFVVSNPEGAAEILMHFFDKLRIRGDSLCQQWEKLQEEKKKSF